jgi:hypothetical protein
MVVLSSIDWYILKEKLPPILAAVENATPGKGVSFATRQERLVLFGFSS